MFLVEGMKGWMKRRRMRTLIDHRLCGVGLIMRQLRSKPIPLLEEECKGRLFI